MGINEGAGAKVRPTTVAAMVAGYIGTLAKDTDDYTMGAQQQLLLLALYIHGELNQMDLPRYTGVEKSANGRNIARLGPGQFVQAPNSERKVHKGGLGLIESYQDPTNRRVNLVRLTPKGKALMEGAATHVAHLMGA